jgi:hypothetical protein
MRLRSSRLVLLLVFTLLSHTVLAEISPQAYMQMQREAPEFVYIKVLNVKVEHEKVRPLPVTKLPDRDFDKVTIRAEVVRVKRSKTKLKNGQIIEIYYEADEAWNSPYNLSQIAGGNISAKKIIQPIKLLKKMKVYPAFLVLDAASTSIDEKGIVSYFPYAYGRSFEIVKSPTDLRSPFY